MDVEPVRIGDADRQRAADVLQHACGAGWLTLEEFSVRVGAVWAADTQQELAQATAGVQVPVVGAGPTVEKIVNVFGDNKRAGRWRLPAVLHLVNVFGSCDLDLREAIIEADRVEIVGRCVFGSVRVIVPEGVEVELLGNAVFGSRSIRLAPVPRLAGTPLVRVRVNAYFGDVSVRSKGPRSGSPVAQWLRQLFSE